MCGRPTLLFLYIIPKKQQFDLSSFDVHPTLQKDTISCAGALPEISRVVYFSTCHICV